MWLDPELSYKFELKNSSEVTQWTVDDVVGVLTADAVNTNSIQDEAVTTAKLANDSVTAAKLKDSASVDADRAVTTDHIRNLAVTRAKLAAGAQAKLTVQSKTAAFTASTDDDVYLCSTSGGAYTATLPSAVGNDGKILDFEKTDTSWNALTIGSSVAVLYGYKESVRIISDGTNWVVLSRTPSVWNSFTPTLTGFGTATSVNFRAKIVGDKLKVNGVFTTGTGTATEARCSLPGSIVSSATKVPTRQLAGLVIHANTGVFYSGMIESGVSYTVFGQSSSASLTTKCNGNDFQNTALTMLDLEIPIDN